MSHVKLLGMIFLAATAWSQTTQTPSAQQNENVPPLKVVSANLLLYPPVAVVAGIQGTVRLRVSMNGTQVTEVHVENGNPVLARAATENVKTWQFKDHSPTSFEISFRYRLDNQTSCYMDNGEVILRLPTEVQITSKRIETCDPKIDLTGSDAATKQ